MTAVLVLAVLALGAILAETRKRLAALELRLLEEPWRDLAQPLATPEVPAPVVPVARVKARALVRPPEPAVSVPLVTKRAVPAEEAPVTAPTITAPEATPEPVPAPEPKPELSIDAAAMPSAGGFAINVEDLFGRKLPIWAGGITLLVAAVFLVRYSIESGLLSPAVRVSLGMLFGFGLIGGAEVARRRMDVIVDPRVPQALAGAGIGTLYAAVLAATNLYDLIGPATGFAALAAITAGAGLLALRFGAPCAVLGLVGGLAAPALISTDQPNAPLLAGYIALLIAGLALLSRRQRWAWLGIGALIGGSLWSTAMIALGTLDSTTALAAGVLVLVLGLGVPTLSADALDRPQDGAVLRFASAAVAALQLALLVARGDFAPLTWGLYGLLSLGFVWLCRVLPQLRLLVLVPLLTALGLMLLWDSPQPGLFAAVLGGTALIFGGQALWQLRRPLDRAMTTLDMLALAAIGLGGHVAVELQFILAPTISALLALALALLPAAGAALLWRHADERTEPPFALGAAVAAMLVGEGWLSLAPAWSAPVGLAALSALLLGLAVKAGNRSLLLGALGFAVTALAALTITGEAGAEWARLLTAHLQPALGQALLRWAFPFAAALGLAWAVQRDPPLSGLVRPVQGAAALLGYGLVAQVVPAGWLGVSAALAAALLLFAMQRRSALAARPAFTVLCALAGAWALNPALQWVAAGLGSLAWAPVMVDALPDLGDALRRMLGPAALLGVALVRAGGRLDDRYRKPALGIVAALAAMGLHVLYKQVFAIADTERFVSLGLAERTLWELLLVGAGALAWRLAAPRAAAVALAGAGLAHGLVYTVVLHDPLWAEQAIGAWPLVNLLLPAYGALFAALWLVARLAGPERITVTRAVDCSRMVLVALLALTTLRQVFAGSVPALVGVGSAEDISWSLAAVALAIGYLLWGIRAGSRDWRLGSLVLMLGAVGKVFVFDASGLEGLARIASFLALGFSLIGIGWLYSRFLKAEGSEG